MLRATLPPSPTSANGEGTCIPTSARHRTCWASAGAPRPPADREASAEHLAACRAGRSGHRPHSRAVANSAVLSLRHASTITSPSSHRASASTGLPSRFSFSSVTIASTPAACSAPITAMRLFGQAKMKRGS